MTNVQLAVLIANQFLAAGLVCGALNEPRFAAIAILIALAHIGASIYLSPKSPSP